MLVGHYSVAMAAKAAEPRAPLWTLVAGCQLVDIVWSVFIMIGVEHFRYDASLPGNHLVFTDIPYTHSLPGSLLWSIGAIVVARFLLRLPTRTSLVIGFVVFSHWLLDLIVHRPDLALWIGGPKIGLGLWNMPAVEMALEMGLVGIGGGIWIAQRKTARQAARPAVAFLAYLTLVQMLASSPSAAPPSTIALGTIALIIYLLTTVIAVFVDRKREGRLS